MSGLLTAPIIVPFVTAIATFLLRDRPKAQRAASVLGSVALFGVSILLLRRVLEHGIQNAELGGWVGPFGICITVDTLSALLVVATALCGIAIVVYSLADVDAARQHFGFHPMYHTLVGGICGAFVTGDLFNMYVWFEVMLISSFALLVLGGEKKQLDGGVKYVAINLISTLLFLSGIGLLYGMTGTLNFADLHLEIAKVESKGLVTTVAVLFIVAFGIKSAVFPLYSWLPASYHTPPVAISAIFSGLLTKVGVYAMVRMFTLVFYEDVAYTQNLILIVAAGTMLSGVLGALSQNEIRRVFAFHIVSQNGYMLMGLALCFATPLALVGVVFYIFQTIVVKANLFLIGGVIERKGGSSDLRQLGGLYATAPVLAILFLIPALSLAGMPPVSGFWAKLTVIKASLDVGSYAIVGVAVFVGLLTVYSISKFWSAAFWKKPDAELKPDPSDIALLTGKDRALLYGPIFALALVTVGVGLFPDSLLVIAERASAELLDPQNYVAAVLGDK